MNADDLRQEVQDLPKTFGKLTAASEQKALYFVKLKRIRALTQQSKVTAEHIQNALSELNKFKTYEVRQ